MPPFRRPTAVHILLLMMCFYLRPAVAKKGIGVAGRNVINTRTSSSSNDNRNRMGSSSGGPGGMGSDGGCDCCCGRGRRYLWEKRNDSEQAIPEEQRLMYYLLDGYEKSVRPVKNSSHAVKAEMGITLSQIFDMDEKNQVLVSNVWLDQKWRDEFLTWDPQNFSKIDRIRIPSGKIWKPDLVLYNNAADFADNMMPALAMVKYDGDVFWPVPTKLKSSCKIDVTYFPFDEQICSLKFGSWTYDGFQVDLHKHKDNVDLKVYVPNGEWQLLKASSIRNIIVYSCCPEPYPDVTFHLYLRRRILYYMYHVIYPCIMMSTLTLLVFCLPPDSGEKIALGITVLLAFSVLMLSIAEKLPETSESVPVISVYLTVVMSMTSVSVIMTVFVLNLHHRGPNKKEVPGWLRTFILRRQDHDQVPDDLHSASEMMKNFSLKLTLESLTNGLREDGLLADEAPIPPSPPTTNLTSTTIDQNHVTSPLPGNTTSYHHPHMRQQTAGAGSTTRGAANRYSSASCSTSGALRASHRTNREILDALRKIIEKHEQDDYEARLIADWRKVAQFVDKVLFWVYLVCTVASTVIILVIAPVFRIIPYNSGVPKAQDMTRNMSAEPPVNASMTL